MRVDTIPFRDLPLDEKLQTMAGWMRERRARQVVALDVRKVSGVTEGVLIASVQSVRQGRSLAEWFVEKVAEVGQDYLGMEGQATGNWILVDLNDVMVHVFLDQIREQFNLEGLYSRARSVDLAPDDSDQPGADLDD